MNKNLLIDNISKLLNLAESEKEFAFRKTIEKVSEKLKYDEALRISELGVFQLKKEPMPRYERSLVLPSAPKEKRTLVYSPPFEKLEGDIKSLFLTLDVDDLNLSVNDDADKVFSISVNKPLIPITDADIGTQGDSAVTSDKDSITDLEYKITTLVNNADVLKDYDIWDDYLNRTEHSEEVVAKTNEDEIDLNDLIFEDSFTKAKVGDEDLTTKDEVQFAPLSKSALDDDLKAFEEAATIEREFGKTVNEEVESLPPKSDAAEIELEVDVASDKAEEPLVGLKKLTKELKAITTEDEEIQKDSDSEFDDYEMPENLEVDEEVIQPDHKNDFEPTEDDIVEEVDFTDAKVDDSADQNTTEDESVFDELENYLDEKEEPSDIVDELAGEEDEGSAPVEPEEPAKVDKENLLAEQQSITQTQDVHEETSNLDKATEKPDEKIEQSYTAELDDEQPFYKKPVVIYSSAGALLVIILILIFFPSGQTSEPTDIGQPIDTESSFQQESVEPLVTEQPFDTVTDSAVESSSELTGLYREIASDVQAANQIYFDGKFYTVQVSSWRSSTIAEREVERLKNLGHDAFIYQVFLESKGSTWNRVRIGYFESLEDAEDFLVKNKF